MTGEEARGRVTEIRSALDRAMRALSVPGPDWGTASLEMADACDTARELTRELAAEDFRARRDRGRSQDGDR